MGRMEPEIQDELERRIYETILSFPRRLDEMETRSEDNCRLLASRIAEVVRQHPGSGTADPG